MSKEIISGQDAAALLHCSYTYLYTFMKQGKLHRVTEPNLKKKQPLQFEREEVEKLVREAQEAQEQEQTSNIASVA